MKWCASSFKFFSFSYNASRAPSYTYYIAEPNASKNNRRYSIILTKFMFIRSEYLFWYTCLLPERVHAYINKNRNCEDIAMQMMISGMTDSPPVAVQVTKPIHDYGIKTGISATNDHINNRGRCLSYFHESFGNKNVLVYSNSVHSIFSKIPFIRKHNLTQ